MAPCNITLLSEFATSFGRRRSRVEEINPKNNSRPSIKTEGFFMSKQELISAKDAIMLYQACDMLNLPNGSLGLDNQGVIVPIIPLIHLDGKFVNQHSSLPQDVSILVKKMNSAAGYLTNPYTPFKSLTSDISHKAIELFKASRQLFLSHRVRGIILPWQIKILSGSYQSVINDNQYIADLEMWLPPFDTQLRKHPIDQKGRPNAGSKYQVSFGMALLTRQGNQHMHIVSYME